MSTKRYFNEILSQNSTQPVEYYKAIDWNQVEDMIDKLTWEKLTEQFWLDTRIPVSNDLDDWRTLSPAEKDVVGKVFGGLTLLDTLQSEEGASLMKDYVRTQHEEAVWNNIQFMESVHAKVIQQSSVLCIQKQKSKIFSNGQTTMNTYNSKQERLTKSTKVEMH